MSIVVKCCLFFPEFYIMIFSLSKSEIVKKNWETPPHSISWPLKEAF